MTLQWCDAVGSKSAAIAESMLYEKFQVVISSRDWDSSHKFTLQGVTVNLLSSATTEMACRSRYQNIPLSVWPPGPGPKAVTAKFIIREPEPERGLCREMVINDDRVVTGT